MNGFVLVSFWQVKGNAKMRQTEVALEGIDDVQVPTVSPNQSGLSGTVSGRVHRGIPLLCRSRRACGVARAGRTVLVPSLQGKTFFLDMAARRLLARGMSFQPDAVIANGDHIYLDIETSLNKPHAKFVQEQLWTKFGGALDLSVPMFHPKNAAIFTAVCDYQIPRLYGTAM